MRGGGTQFRAPRGERELTDILASVVALIERLESDVSRELALVEHGSAGDGLSAHDLDRVSRPVTASLPILRKALVDLRNLQKADSVQRAPDRVAGVGIRTPST